jgi:hypothetical protein
MTDSTIYSLIIAALISLLALFIIYTIYRKENVQNGKAEPFDTLSNIASCLGD